MIAGKLAKYFDGKFNCFKYNYDNIGLQFEFGNEPIGLKIWLEVV